MFASSYSDVESYFLASAFSIISSVNTRSSEVPCAMASSCSFLLAQQSTGPFGEFFLGRASLGIVGCTSEYRSHHSLGFEIGASELIVSNA